MRKDLICDLILIDKLNKQSVTRTFPPKNWNPQAPETFENVLKFAKEMGIPAEEIRVRMEWSKDSVTVSFLGYYQGIMTGPSYTLKLPIENSGKTDLFKMNLKNKKGSKFPFELESFSINVGMFSANFKKKT